MIDVSNSVKIDRPVSEVFAFTLDQHNTPRWQKAVTDVEAPPAPVKPGYRFVNVRNFMGMDMKTNFEIVEIIPDTRFVLKSTGGEVSVQVTFLFQPADNGTNLTIHMQADVGGFFKVAEGMVGQQMLSQIRENQANLRSLLENN
jgi:uncharacterized membrane protein